jgi:hypothetical protein
VPLNGLGFQLQAGLSPTGNSVRLPRADRADIVAGETVIYKIKSIEHIPPVHETQLPAVSPIRLLRDLREHRALRASGRPPPGRDHTNVTDCHKQSGRRQEQRAASNPSMTTRNVNMRIAGHRVSALSQWSWIS